MGFITWIIFGLIAGAIAKLIMPGTQGGGWLMTIILGIVGAFVGGFIGSFLGWGTTDSFDFRSMLLAVGGALIVLWIYGMVTKKG
ncbi:GlsB/YeaQ/YmgE family stress response membrane protein [Chryseobacterium oryctis]|uniref:GlsB/YeaQ/YmgE family stress response membrane protein n=1 Tax=Chryseobacterium oryctis TaxID=2952618 RepID=A0ABT3HJR4_9FLAO|nr:GlsB/YeaQ/YmgE family stress response membrane protein [Chryseobacterium oryctis]MCW3160040.1 GlsB/YeaQ/YmgE family stress response membrane protein [Chryseobacterium oryctis]